MKTITQSFRFLHVMLRVTDLERSIAFYTKLFGLTVLRQTDYPSGHFTLAFLGFKEESDETVIELTYNWGEQSYDKGNAFGHLAFGVENISEFCQYLRKAKVNITREPGPMQFDSNELIAFIKDPDGYSIELIQSENAK